MAQLFVGPTTEFLRLTTQNLIAETLRQAFVDYQGFEPSDLEVRSWRNSLRALANALQLGAFLDHGIFLEYQLPLSSLRIDALITGADHAGREVAVIVELKQWDDVEASPVPECVAVRYGKGLRDRLHPSAQVGRYRQYLADSQTAFHEGGIGLRACAFLHDFIYDDQSELVAPRHANLLTVYPLFAGDRTTDLVQFLHDHLGAGRGLPVMQRVREGQYRPHKKLLAHTAAMIKNEPVYVLLDEQRVVFNSVLARVTECADLDQRAVFCDPGRSRNGQICPGPQLGRRALSVRLCHSSRDWISGLHERRASAAQQFKYFNSYLDADPGVLDVLICDEAHRIRTHSWSRLTKKRSYDPDRAQVDELLRVARAAVFFIDDLQTVRREEIESSSLIEQHATRAGADVYTYDLNVQFRCGGADGFVRWVEQTLHIRSTANKLWAGDHNFEFEIVDSAPELEALIRAKDGTDGTARLVAGFCWPWSDPAQDGTLIPDVQIDEWAMPWNAKPERNRLAAGIPKSHLWASEPGGIDQIGCIYTAQGFEFDYVGVVWGNDLVYRPRQGWIGRPEFSWDSVVKRGTSSQRFADLVKNTYRVLLSRGLKGCYVYFLDDPTRDFVLSRVDELSMGMDG